MSIERDRLLNELRSLRRGHGLGGSLAEGQIGASLLVISKAAPGADTAAVTKHLTAELLRLIGELPEDLQMFAKAALNIGKTDDRNRFLEKRIAWLSERTNRDPRTVRRRIDEAMNRLVELVMVEQNWEALDRQETSSNWYTKSCRTLLRMNLSTPEAVDEREIVVQRSAINSISVPFTLPRHPDDRSESHELQTEILFGGKFVASKRVSDSRFDIKIQFPGMLEPGENHRYAIIYRVPDGQRMTPRYVFVPYHRCDFFDLRIRFATDAVPQDIRRITEAFHREIEDLQPDEDILEADESGEVRVQFDNLKTGFGYGIQWTTKKS